MAGTSGLRPQGSDNVGKSFEEAKSTLYGTISASGPALEAASKRRKSTVHAMTGYLQRLKLDVSGLSVIHVTGTKGKGSTCTLAESVLRHHGFTTGLFTSPHLLEVTERVRVNGKPLSKEAFAKYFFEVWDRLQATRGGKRVIASGLTAESRVDAPADMPTFFHLITLVGLWCFVKEGVDVCVIEVGMGGRFDATNVLPMPVVCGVTMLDLDHTQILGETLDEIAWEKGGIFKAGCRAFVVEQPRGGMSVLRQCAQEAGCKLEVVTALPTHDPAGTPYCIGLAGEHQRVNAALALYLCAAWMKTRRSRQGRTVVAKQSTPDVVTGVTGRTGEAVSADNDEGEDKGGEGIAVGGAELSWSLQSGRGTESFLRSAEVHKGLSECSWPGRCQIFRPPEFPHLTVYLDGAHTEQSMHACLQWFAAEVDKTTAVVAVAHVINSAPKNTLECIEKGVVAQSHEAQRLRRRKRSRRVLWFYASHERDVLPLLGALSCAWVSYASKAEGLNLRRHEDEKEDGPLFDEACFMEINSGRPSRFTPPTAQEILSRHGVPVAAIDLVESNRAANLRGEGSGVWQRTLEQVWVSLQASKRGMQSTTLIGTATKLLENCTSAERMRGVGGEDAMAIPAIPGDPGRPGEGPLVSDNLEPTEILCTGSLYAVAAALEAMKAEVA